MQCSARASLPSPSLAPRGDRAQQRSTIVCHAGNDVNRSGRRSVLLGLTSAGALLTKTWESQAAVGRWDGEKGLGMCDLGADGDQCRLDNISKDAGKKEDYGAVTSKTYTPATGVPVSEMGDQYAQDTFALKDKISEYVSLDPYDKRRPALFKDVKKTSNEWVGAYARGGNVRKQSARSFYVAVDSLQGHIAQNGLAPYPQGKVGKLLQDMETGCTYITEGK